MKTIICGTWAAPYGADLGGKIVTDKGEVIKEVGVSVSDVVFDAKKNLLFSLIETNNKNGGTILTHQREDSGNYTELESVSSCGAHPIKLALLDDYALVVNHGSTVEKIVVTKRDYSGRVFADYEYAGASLVLFERHIDGTIGEALDCFVFDGSGPIAPFQESASPHSIYYDQINQAFYIPERGTDCVSAFSVFNGKLKLIGKMQLPSGFGPRNVTMDEHGKYIYVMSEIVPQVAVYERLTTESEVLFYYIRQVCSVSRHYMDLYPEGASSFDALHPSAIYYQNQKLYVLTRCSDTITTYEAKDGNLSMLECKLFGGTNAREMWLEGRDMYIVAQGSQSIVHMKLNEDGIPFYSGMLFKGIANLGVCTVSQGNL